MFIWRGRPGLLVDFFIRPPFVDLAMRGGCASRGANGEEALCGGVAGYSYGTIGVAKRRALEEAERLERFRSRGEVCETGGLGPFASRRMFGQFNDCAFFGVQPLSFFFRLCSYGYKRSSFRG